MLSIRLSVYTRLSVDKFLDSEKICDFLRGGGVGESSESGGEGWSAPLTAALFKDQL